MRGHIFLSGGGGQEDTVELDEKFFSILPKKATILYIPIALNRNAAGFKACYKWFSDCIFMHAKNKNIKAKMILQNDKVPELSKFNAVYIGGGNTFKLLTYIIQNELDKKLTNYVKKGGVLYGGSAGAIILGKDINTVKEENEDNSKYSQGLNLLKGLSFICHYQPKLDKKIEASVSELKTPIVALSENAGIAIHPNSTEIINSVYIFNKKKNKLNVNQLKN